ncbi:hypothetical protein [Sphingomonas hankookensis]|uniref:UrcA family protein n=1 Tax=Sphingomonas hankookensis TaxID=563996 RepID=A0ABR5YAP0_9SPHN|nr:hypothetical protein [Sphingomonas hankookensis]KZE12057.1 hypothetical protein AVT10_16765 [Sphingomonas hankookensis]
MSAAPRKPMISVTMSWEDREIFEAESQRAGEHLTATMLRLAKLGLAQQEVTPAAALPHGLTGGEPVPRLPANTAAIPSTDLVATASPGTAVTAPLRPRDEPIVGSAIPRRHDRSTELPWWMPIPATAAPVGSDKARWAGVGVLSTLLALMLIPANGMAAAAVSQVALGTPGDGIAASNLLFERYSKRAGPLRHWNATARVADNAARVKACTDRADRFADYRRLTTCEIFVSGRKRAIEIGQGIVD